MSFRPQSIPVTSHHAQLLSNGRYAVMLTAAGSGFSRWGDLAVTRWREDPTCDGWGSYVFLRDVQTGRIWSAGYQPAGREPDSYEVVFSEDRAKIARQDGSIITTLDVLVSPEDDAEVRRVSVMNLGARTREIELTSYAEVVLVPPAADAAHPAFSNLFVQTECVPDLDVLLATRRPRSPDEPRLWLAHVVAVEGETVDEGERHLRPVELGHRDRPVEGDDGGRGDGVQLVVELRDLGPMVAERFGSDRPDAAAARGAATSGRASPRRSRGTAATATGSCTSTPTCPTSG